MIVGNGMLAKKFRAFEKEPGFIIFASGVSDSSTSMQQEFDREKKLLLAQAEPTKSATLVYFSTCSIYDESLENSAYVNHKLQMEKLIEEHFSSWIIFRVSNPIGFTNNKHTVFNYFIQHINAGSPFQIWAKAERNILDIDDMYLACCYYLQQPAFKNRKIDIANPNNYSVTEIVQAIEKHFGKKGKYEMVNKGGGPKIDQPAMEILFRNLNISFDADYLNNILQKYFKSV